MKTKAAVLTDRNVPWEIMELDVRDPKEGEVLIRYTAAGLCHSDMHLVTGDLPSPIDPPSGCVFRTRCPKATSICTEVVPPLTDYGRGHLAACHHVGDVEELVEVQHKVG